MGRKPRWPLRQIQESSWPLLVTFVAAVASHQATGQRVRPGSCLAAVAGLAMGTSWPLKHCSGELAESTHSEF